MRRLVCWMAAVAALTSGAGCCASPYRFWQNARGWEDPVADRYAHGPPAIKSTPPGPTTSATVLPKTGSI